MGFKVRRSATSQIVDKQSELTICVGATVRASKEFKLHIIEDRKIPNRELEREVEQTE